jgi:hypothetical protein
MRTISRISPEVSSGSVLQRPRFATSSELLVLIVGVLVRDTVKNLLFLTLLNLF